MVKYEIKHELVKELGLKKSMAQMADSTIDHIGHVMDNTTLKDYAFMVSWGAMSYLLVQSGAIKELMKAGGKLSQFATMTTATTEGGLTGLLGSGSLATWGLNIGKYIYLNITGQEDPTGGTYTITEPPDPTLGTQILLSLVISYFVLTQGVDIASAVLTLGGKI